MAALRATDTIQPHIVGAYIQLCVSSIVSLWYLHPLWFHFTQNCQDVVIKERKHVFITTWNPRWLPVWPSPLGKVIKIYKSPNIQHRDLILVSIPTFWSTNNHTEYTTFFVEHEEKHNYSMDSKPSFVDYVNIHIFWYFFLNLNFQGFMLHWCTRSEFI